MTAVYLKDTGDAEDRAYEDHRQRELDDAREAELAFFAGKEARREGKTAGMNPYRSHHEVSAWSRGWTQVDGEMAATVLARRAA